MTQPTPYNRVFNFTSFSAASPSLQQPGVQLDAEYNAIKRTTDALILNLGRIQRDDLSLANGVVTPDSLNATTLALVGGSAGWNPRGAWAGSTAYAVKDFVTNAGISYVCSTAHTSSGVFDATKWTAVASLFSGSGAEVVINPMALDTTGLGDRGPLFIWNNPAPGSIAAGYNAGFQVYIGANPGGTPGSGDAIGGTVLVTNENGRTGMWGLDIVVLQVGPPLTGNDGPIRGIEVEISTVVTEQLDPFVTSGNPRKDGIELVHNAHGITKRGTAAAWLWSADAATAGMWSRGIALSRIADVGIDFGTWQGDTATNSFQTAAIYDRSGSAVVIKVDGTHNAIFDFSGASSLGNFVTGLSGTSTNLFVKNNANFDVTLGIDSGNNATKQAIFQFKDQGTAKWSFIKNNANGFSLFNHATSKSTIFVDTGDFIALGGGITPSQVLDVNDNSIRVRTAKTPASGSAAGNAGQICWDSGFLYVCTATNTWKRVAIAGGF